MWFNRVIQFLTCSKDRDLANGMADRIQQGTWLLHFCMSVFSHAKKYEGKLK